MSDRGKSVSGWFDGQSRVETVSLRDLLGAAKAGAVGLPMFQRGQVWNAGKIAYLWDSLLKGYPIGSLMLVKDQKGKLQRGDGSHSWLLLDGQQRYSAISLGHQDQLDKHSRPERRLWIDLKHFLETQKNSGSSPFYLTTLSHPWGIQVRESDASSTPATESDRKTGRETLKKFFDDKEEPDDLWFWGSDKVKHARKEHRWDYPDPWVNMKYTWPVQAEWPIPLPEVISWALGTKNLTNESLRQKLPGMFPEGLWDEVVANSVREEDLLNAGENLCLQFRELLDYQVVLIRVPVSADNKRAGKSAAEELNEVFQRINRQGASLSEAELFFSTVKLHCKNAHEYVARVHANHGKLLQPLEIVHGAARLVRSQPEPSGDLESADGLDDLPRLSLRNYKSLVDNRSGEDKATHFLEQMARYLSDAGSSLEGEERIDEALQSLRRALSYDPQSEQGDKDIGLPLPLLANLNWRVWHCMLGWAIRQNGEDMVLSNRRNLIRFALLYHFFNNSNAQGGTRFIFTDARWRGYKGKEFPAKELAGWLHENNYLFAYDTGGQDRRAGILTPCHYSEAAETSSWILHNETDLLFWAQRDWVYRWFDGIYDPLHHVRADEKPFDIDHIVPRDWFTYVNNEARDSFNEAWKIRNSIGNLRIWPRPLNRSEGKKRLRARHLIDGENGPNSLYEFWGLSEAGNIPLASAIAEDEQRCLKVVEDDAASERDWSNPERSQSFKEFTNHRRCRLYKDLYDTLGMKELDIDSTDKG